MIVLGYTKSGMIRIEIDGQELIVPDDTANRHRQMIAEWEAEGNTIPAYEAPPPPVPTSITRRQLLIALAQMEIITGEEALAAAKTGAVPTAVQAVFDNMKPADKLAAEITWASMSVAERANPLVAALAQANGMTDSEIDDFFRFAANI